MKKLFSRSLRSSPEFTFAVIRSSLGFFRRFEMAYTLSLALFRVECKISFAQRVIKKKEFLHRAKFSADHVRVYMWRVFIPTLKSVGNLKTILEQGVFTQLRNNYNLEHAHVPTFGVHYAATVSTVIKFLKW